MAVELLASNECVRSGQSPQLAGTFQMPNPCHSIAPAMGTRMNRAVAFPLDATWLRASVCENNEAPPLLTGALLRLSILTRWDAATCRGHCWSLVARRGRGLLRGAGGRRSCHIAGCWPPRSADAARRTSTTHWLRELVFDGRS